ncbi:MAG TPA: GNAT family N-acetyltransferase [Bacteroidia bacterium]|nr:GNAT family N-acetyltransferase [Bacteroidia bacterium]
MFPVLQTDRLLLRGISGNDAPVIFRLYADENVMHYRGCDTFSNLEQAEQLIFHWRKLFATGHGIRWGIEWNETNQLLGTVGFKQILIQHRRADLGYELDPAWWNRGIMTEAVNAIVQHGFDVMNLHSIEANITPGHLASQRVLEKLKFEKEALFRENYFYKHWWDSEIWSLRKK